jgi:lipoate-protein ligase A
MYKSLYKSLGRNMARHISISEARGKLPQIAKLLKRSPDEVVLVEHRDLDDRLAIVSERHLRNLESIVKSLKDQFSKPFRLAGSIESELSDQELEEALETIKKEQESKAVVKLKDL